MRSLPEASPAVLRARYAGVIAAAVLLAVLLGAWVWTLVDAPRTDPRRLGVHGPLWAGLVTQLPDLRAAGGFPVDSVWAGPAAAGMRPGDLIVAVDGVSLKEDPGALHRRLLQAGTGDTVVVTWRRGDLRQSAPLAVGAPDVERWRFRGGTFTFPIAPAAATWLLWGTDLLVPLLILIIAAPLGLARPRDAIAFRVSIFLLATAIFELPESVPGLGTRPAWFLVSAEAAIGIALPVAAYFSIRTLGRFPYATAFGARYQRWLRWLLPLVVLYAAIRVLGTAQMILRGWGGLSRAAETLTDSWMDTGFIVAWGLAALPLLIAQRLAVRGRPLARLRVIEVGLVAMLVSGLWSVLASPAGLLFHVFRPEGRVFPVVVWSVDQFVPTLLLMLLPISIAHAVVARHVFGVRVILRRGVRALLLSRGVLLLEGLLLFVILAAALRHGASRLGGSSAAAAGVAAVISAAAVLAFTRVNRPLMRTIDRRFFRESYDARHLLMRLAEQVAQIRERGEVLRRAGEEVIKALHPARLAFFLAEQAGGETHLAWAGVSPSGDPGALLELHLPLLSRAGPVGSMALAGKLSEEPYSREDRELLATVATQVGLALEVATLLEVAKREAEQSKELEIARRVQQDLFPTDVPSVPGWDIAALCRPARAVGGDYVDVFALGPDRIAFAVGDVSGKGAGPALLMAGVHATIRSRLPQEPDDLVGLMTALNRHLIESSAPEMFITLFLGVLEVRSGEIRYVNGGHPGPLLVRPDAGVIRPETAGLVVGCIPDSVFPEGRTTLEPGGHLYVFSDGVTEALDEAGDMFDEPRLEEVVRRAAGLSAREALDRVLGSVEAFAGAREQADDISLVVIRREP
jgi:sigma-B regulation protein RsbU (phosphoserine phosphatase)